MTGVDAESFELGARAGVAAATIAVVVLVILGLLGRLVYWLVRRNWTRHPVDVTLNVAMVACYCWGAYEMLEYVSTLQLDELATVV